MACVSGLYLIVTFIDCSIATPETKYKHALPESDVGNLVNKKTVIYFTANPVSGQSYF